MTGNSTQVVRQLRFG